MIKQFALFALLVALSSASITPVGWQASGIPSSCTITPSSIAIAVDGQKPVYVSCRDGLGKEVTCPQMSWSSTIGSISFSSDPLVFLAGTTAGTGTITATSSPSSDPQFSCSIPVTVLPGAPSRLSVTPESAKVPVGSTQQFFARLFDKYGNEIANSFLAQQFSWSIESEYAIGEVSQTGLFSASAKGEGRVIAVYSATPASSEVFGSARVSVVPKSAGTYCVISPQGAQVKVSSTLRLSVKCYQEDPRSAKAEGIEIECPAMGWSATEGTIIPDPLPSADERAATYTAGTIARSVLITAYDATPNPNPASSLLSCTTYVQVVPGEPASVSILPTSVSLYVGDSQRFQAFAYDKYGNAIQGSEFSWSASGGIGEVDSEGRFSATKAGTGAVKAELVSPLPAKELSATAQVNVLSQGSPGGGGGGGGGGSGTTGGGSFASSSTLSYTCAGAPATLKVKIFKQGSTALAEIFHLGTQTSKVFSSTVSNNVEVAIPLEKSGDYELRVSVGTEQRNANFYVPPCTPTSVNITKNITIELKEPPTKTVSPPPAQPPSGGAPKPNQQVQPPATQPKIEEGVPLAVFLVVGLLLLAAAAFLLFGKKKEE
ncbi:MAG: Ig-like domain-containing protein [Candidatus Micrarchaeota archaeon]|nr:Ig-like domain-containing protein [Candidatus Micrarchaeota archaeon]